ncbi:MAG TPA: OsmC family protein, partial [Methanotrichaceae archaeon]|nr:OsmC family protein [Methanotrichaceae archaeon]
YNAMARGISLQKVSIDLKGDIDLRGFLGISPEVRPGYQKMCVSCQVKSDASREELEDLWAYVQRTSPVLDVISSGVPVSVSLSRE